MNEDSVEFLEILEELIDEGFLVRDSDAHGAAKQCAGKGMESLSRAQKYFYDTEITPLLLKKSCPVPSCGDRIHQGFSRCSYHQSQMDNSR